VPESKQATNNHLSQELSKPLKLRKNRKKGSVVKNGVNEGVKNDNIEY
jgi:hypothetical protein